VVPPIDASTIEQAIAAAMLTPVTEYFYRSVNFARMRRHNLRLLDGTHAGITGGRYNAPYSEPTAYFAGSQTVAAFEAEQVALIAAPPQPPEPRLTVALSISAPNILDLTNSIVLANLGVDSKDLLTPTLQWQHLNREGMLAQSQLLGAMARRRPDVDGLRIPSWVAVLLPPGSLPRSDNLVLFMDPAHPTAPRGPATVTVHDPTGLAL
jgi:RES domain-containing protein